MSARLQSAPTDAAVTMARGADAAVTVARGPVPRERCAQASATYRLSARACPSRTDNLQFFGIRGDVVARGPVPRKRACSVGETSRSRCVVARGPVPREPSIKMKTLCALTKRAYRRCCYHSARACPSRATLWKKADMDIRLDTFIRHPPPVKS